MKRRVRAKRLGARLGLHVFRTGIMPAAQFGVATSYPTKTTISGMRTAASSTLGSAKGSSVTARLAIRQCDPAYDLAVKVIKTLVNAVWDQQVEGAVMAAAWRRAQGHEANHHSKSAQFGAAGAFAAALKQVGWTAPAYNVVITRLGSPLNLNEVDPKTVLRFL